jgi:DNA-binding transcriptional MerR regulator
MATMNIGQLARLAGVSIDTIRYYERQFLLAAASRSAAGYRKVGEPDLERLRFIRRSKDLGFSPTEIRELLSLTSDRDTDLQRVKHKAELSGCPIVAALSGSDDPSGGMP